MGYASVITAHCSFGLVEMYVQRYFRGSGFTFVNKVVLIIFICSSHCDEQQCFLENFSVVLCETSIKIFRYLTHEKYINSFFTELMVSAIFYCSNAITKKLDTMKIPLDLV